MYLTKLNPKTNKKLLMIHADDAGLSHSQNKAIISCLEEGNVNSYSIMVPCAHFKEIADFAKKNPKYDYGIHLTLTCEWEKHRFGPVLPLSEVPSLVDKNGHFYKKKEHLQKHSLPSEIEKELKAQIDLAFQYGLQPSHIDSHMYSVACSPAIFKIYKELEIQYQLPVLISRNLFKNTGYDLRNNINQKDLTLEQIHMGTFKEYETGKLGEYYENVLQKLEKGVNLLLIHPAFDDDEMKSITVNHSNFGSEWREIDYNFFTSKRCKTLLQENSIELVDWRDLIK
tara:strand:- start:809 stop:1660 length:852 start_codon:yes stop_codon:yes gene_type:complete